MASITTLGDCLGDCLGDSLGGEACPTRIAELAGGSYRLEYDGESIVIGGLGPPDVVTAINLQGNASYDTTQPVAAMQPSSVDALGLKGIQFVEGDEVGLNLRAVPGSPPVANVGDSIVILVSGRMDAVLTFSTFLFFVGYHPTPSFVSFGFGPTGIRAFAATGVGLQLLTSDYSDTVSRHVWRVSLLPDRVSLHQDGLLLEENVITTGGIPTDIIASGLADEFGTNATMFRSVMLTNPTTQQISNVEAEMIANPGVPA